MITVPEVRCALASLAGRMYLREVSLDDAADEIADLIDGLVRRPCHFRGHNLNPAPTPDLVREVSRDFPKASHAQLATLLGTTSAHVSYVLYGRRRDIAEGVDQ